MLSKVHFVNYVLILLKPKVCIDLFKILFILRHPTDGENIIATIKMRNNFYPLKMAIFPLDPHLNIALPTL